MSKKPKPFSVPTPPRVPSLGPASPADMSDFLSKTFGPDATKLLDDVVEPGSVKVTLPKGKRP